jgi:hypothetical protein
MTGSQSKSPACEGLGARQSTTGKDDRGQAGRSVLRAA